MIFEHEHGREPDISAPKEIIGTTVFTAIMVCLIVVVL
jgi:hypothetical protein